MKIETRTNTFGGIQSRLFEEIGELTSHELDIEGDPCEPVRDIARQIVTAVERANSESFGPDREGPLWKAFKSEIQQLLTSV